MSGAYSSGNIYSTGLTNTGAAVGGITFTVAAGAPNTLYYVCQYHSSMAGTILIIGLIVFVIGLIIYKTQVLDKQEYAPIEVIVR